ncbi:hypothetical protein P7C71_g1303, partial [Lecanoromycetidae sp. Uapishka_2]
MTVDKQSKSTMYRRDETYAFWPFPGNQSTVISAATEPVDSPSGDLTIDPASFLSASTAGGIPRKFIDKKCTLDQKQKITAAWEEAKLLAQAQTTYKLLYQYNIPHTRWLGKDWNSQGSYIPWRYDFRKLIGASAFCLDNLTRLAKLYSDRSFPAHEFIYWYCYDDNNVCNDFTQAVSWDSIGTFWSNHYTVFCPNFYGRATLATKMDEYANNLPEQKVMENFQLNRGHIMLHETYHYKDLVSQPRIEDYDDGYQAQSAWDLAKNKGTNFAYLNADSYAFDALAIYIQQYYESTGRRQLNQQDLRRSTPWLGRTIAKHRDAGSNSVGRAHGRCTATRVFSISFIHGPVIRVFTISLINGEIIRFFDLYLVHDPVIRVFKSSHIRHTAVKLLDFSFIYNTYVNIDDISYRNSTSIDCKSPTVNADLFSWFRRL